MPMLMLGDLPIRIGGEVIAKLTSKMIPGTDPTRPLTRKESSIRIGVKALLQTTLHDIERDITKKGYAFPLAGRCPKDQDFIVWGLRYLFEFYEFLERAAVYQLDYVEGSDGSLTLTDAHPLTGVAAAAAVVDALPSEHAAAAALPAPAAAPSVGGADSGEPLGSLVHRGVHGVGQDAVRQAISEAVTAALPGDESLHSGFEGR